MLIKSGDLWPVCSSAARIPWTRRRAVIRNFLHVGQVCFETLVYDTNVGDIAPLSSFFNRRVFSVSDLNYRFGRPVGGAPQTIAFPEVRETSNSSSPEDNSDKVERVRATLCPRLVIFLGHSDSGSNKASSEGSVSPSEGELFLQRLQGSNLFKMPRISPSIPMDNGLKDSNLGDGLLFTFDDVSGNEDDDDDHPRAPRGNVPGNSTCFEQMCNFESMANSERKKNDFNGSFLCDINIDQRSIPSFPLARPPVFDWLLF